MRAPCHPPGEAEASAAARGGGRHIEDADEAAEREEKRPALADEALPAHGQRCAAWRGRAACVRSAVMLFGSAAAGVHVEAAECSLSAADSAAAA